MCKVGNGRIELADRGNRETFRFAGRWQAYRRLSRGPSWLIWLMFDALESRALVDWQTLTWISMSGTCSPEAEGGYLNR